MIIKTVNQFKKLNWSSEWNSNQLEELYNKIDQSYESLEQFRMDNHDSVSSVNVVSLVDSMMNIVDILSDNVKVYWIEEESMYSIVA